MSAGPLFVLIAAAGCSAASITASALFANPPISVGLQLGILFSVASLGAEFAAGMAGGAASSLALRDRPGAKLLDASTIDPSNSNHGDTQW